MWFCCGVDGEVSGGVAGGGSSQVGELLRGGWGVRGSGPWVCHVWDCSREKTEKETNVLGFGHVRFLRVVR